ncbi:putative uncharacterized protein [Clostridium sp. CAG:1013]|nr:putative uncharacterized protein [Clostridium sp. CAG:1013]
MKLIRRLGGWRELLLRAMGWLHCALLVALYYGTILRVILGEESLSWSVWRGLLIAIPFAAVDFAGEFSRKMWQFLLVGLVSCGLAWLLLGYPLAAVPVVVVCFFRGRNRIAEDPVESALDAPHLPLVLAVLLPFVYSAMSGGARLQKVCFLWATAYLLLWGARTGLARIQRYLSLNQKMAGVPVKRIVRTTGLAVLAMVVFAGALLLPALLMEDGYFHIEEQKRQTQAVVEMEETQVGNYDIPQWMKDMGENSSFKIPPFFTYFLIAVGVALAAFALLYGVYLILRNFRGSFVDHRDVVQYLRGEEDQAETVQKEKRKRPAFWDRSPNAQVRRKYRRTVLRLAQEQPPQWAAPQEIEDQVGLQDQRLHALYEKARYSMEGCTIQESRELK